MRRLIAFLGVAGSLVASCAQAGELPPFTQAMADAIVDRCGAPKGILWAEGDTARFEPPQDLPYDISACLLKGIRDSGAAKIGFVGNDKPVEPTPRQPLTPEIATEIEGICGLPAGALTENIQVPNVSEFMPRMACAVAEGRKRNVLIGFISNPVDPNAQTH